MATIRDVAAAAGVSYQTVSRVLNDRPKVSAATRERVEEAIERLGFRRNAAATALVSGRTNTIGVLTAAIPNYGPAAITHGITVAAQERGWDVAIASLDDATEADARHAMRALLAQDVRALVLVVPAGGTRQAAGHLRSPVPVLVAGSGDAAEVVSVRIDQAAGTRKAVLHLAELGHTRIVHLAGPPNSLDAETRLDTWRGEVERLGLEPPPAVPGDWTAASGFAAAGTVAELGTAVFAANDQMAMGLIAGLAALGKGVPTDISVVGFDDLPESPFTIPALTTVRQDFAVLAEQVIEALTRLVQGEEAASVVLEPHLVVRASTARPAAGPAAARG